MNFGALIAGWLFPGLGQIVLGERRRGVLAMTGVLILFVGGLLIGGLDCVDKDEDRLWFIGQAAAGPIAFAAAYGNEALIKSGRFGELVPTPVSDAQVRSGMGSAKVSTFKGLAHANEFGTLFCFLAGLMNFIVILDAFIRPRAEDTHGRRGTDGQAVRRTA
jgi:hypothetical protein